MDESSPAERSKLASSGCQRTLWQGPSCTPFSLWDTPKEEEDRRSDTRTFESSPQEATFFGGGVAVARRRERVCAGAAVGEKRGGLGW